MKFRLIKPTEYASYQKRLLDFEKQFTYPLGDSEFTIEHGIKNGDYFEFFKSLGELKCFVLEKNGIVYGCGCAILRDIETRRGRVRYWYLCDFKLENSVRGKGYITKLIIKYFFPHCFYCQDILAINMSPQSGNRLIKKFDWLLKLFSIQTKPVYFYEWSFSDFLSTRDKAKEFFHDFVLYTNYGMKDIVVSGEQKPIVHLVSREHAINNLNRDSIVNLIEDPGFDYRSAMFMLATTSEHVRNELLKYHIKENFHGTAIARKKFSVDLLEFSSAEI